MKLYAKWIAIMVLTMTFMVGCQGGEKDVSSEVPSTEEVVATQVEAENISEEAAATESVETEESAEMGETDSAQEIDTEKTGLDLDAIASEMGYTEFLYYDEKKAFAFHPLATWEKNDEIKEKNGVEYIMPAPNSHLSYSPSVHILYNEYEAYSNLPNSFIEYMNNKEPTDYYKSREAELVCELEVPVYGTSYLFCIKKEVDDPAVESGYSNSYEVIVPCNKGAACIFLSIIYPDQEKNVNDLTEVVGQLFEKVDQMELPDNFEQYLKSADGENLIGYNVPEGYELSSESSDASSQTVTYKKGEEEFYLSTCPLGSGMDGLYETGEYSSDYMEYTEKDSVETAYGIVKFYEELNKLTDITLRNEVALVKFKGEIYKLSYMNWDDAYYLSPTSSDEWKGDIKNLVTEVF